MPNPSSRPATTHMVALDHLDLLQAQGPDATTFLHGQLTADLKDLKEARWAAYCTAQGRALTLFLVVPTPGGYLLRLREGLAVPMLARLRLYVLRAKLELTHLSDWQGLGIIGPDASQQLTRVGVEPSSNVSGIVKQDGLTVIHREGDTPRFEVWGPPEHVRVLEERLALPRAVAEMWMGAEIRAGIPEITPETSELFIPQMLNLDALGGISLSKGCYPGQEIVARTHYLGRLKQRLYRASAKTPDRPKAGTPLFAPNFPGQTVGQVVDAVEAGHQMDMLAVVQIESARGGVIHLATEEGPLLQLGSLPYPVPGPSG